MTMWLITKATNGKFCTVREIGFVGALGAVEWSSTDFPSLAAARSVVPDGAEKIPRAPDDDPRVIETWRRA